MRGEKVGNAERQTMWGNCGFKWRVLGLQLSDLDKILYRHTLGDEERSCVSPMSVIIMGAEICWSTCFATLQICELTAFEATRRDQMDVSEARNLCWRTRVKDNDS